jgi:enolase
MPQDQVGIDTAMIGLDGTKNKSKLGANAILGVSMAAAPCRRPRPSASPSTATSAARTPRSSRCPLMNIMNGGAHSDAPVDIQEFMVDPEGRQVLRRGASHAAPRSSTP